jgi:hypothetical protein
VTISDNKKKEMTLTETAFGRTVVRTGEDVRASVLFLNDRTLSREMFGWEPQGDDLRVWTSGEMVWEFSDDVEFDLCFTNDWKPSDNPKVWHSGMPIPRN